MGTFLYYICLFTAYFFSCRWIYLELKEREKSPYLWVFITLLLGPTLGIIIYLLMCYYKGYKVDYTRYKNYLIIIIVAIAASVIIRVMQVSTEINGLFDTMIALLG